MSTRTIWNVAGSMIATEPGAGRPLARLVPALPGNRDWCRAGWSLATRLDPDRAGPAALSGLVVLIDRDVKPAPGPAEVLSAEHDGGVPDLVAGELVWTWSLVEKPVEVRRAELKVAATAASWAHRNAGVTVTVGQGEVTLATSHAAAVELLEAANHVGGGGSLKVVTRSGARLTLNTAITNAARNALRAHFAAGTEFEHDMHAAIDAAEGHAAFDLIDVAAGTVDGVSLWPPP